MKTDLAGGGPTNNFFQDFSNLEMLNLENYPTDPPEICVGVAPERISPAKNIFVLIRSSELS